MKKLQSSGLYSVKQMLFNSTQHDTEERPIFLTQAPVRLVEPRLGPFARELMLSLQTADFEPATAKCGRYVQGLRAESRAQNRECHNEHPSGNA